MLNNEERLERRYGLRDHEWGRVKRKFINEMKSWKEKWLEDIISNELIWYWKNSRKTVRDHERDIAERIFRAGKRMKIEGSEKKKYSWKVKWRERSWSETEPRKNCKVRWNEVSDERRNGTRRWKRNYLHVRKGKREVVIEKIWIKGNMKNLKWEDFRKIGSMEIW